MLRQQVQLLTVVTEALDRAVKVAAVEVLEGLHQEQVALEEQVDSQPEVAVVEVDQLMDQTQAPVAQVVLV